MKWGVRKDRGKSGSGKRRSKKTKTLSEAQKVSADRRSAVSKDRLKTMSDEELNSRISRLQQEKKLQDLTFNSEATKGERAKRAVGRALKSSTGKAAKVMLSAVIGAASVAGLAYIDRMTESQAIKTAAQKGATIRELAIQYQMDNSLVERIVAGTEGVILDPAKKVDMFRDMISFARSTLKKGK